MKPTLEAELDGWLSRTSSQAEPRFPPELERVYQAAMAPKKISDCMISTIIGTVTGVLLTPLLWFLLPERFWLERWIWCVTSVPVGIISCLLLRTKLPLFWQEIQSIISSIVVALAFSLVMLAGGQNVLPVYLGGFILLVVMNTVAAVHRLRLTITHSVLLTAIFSVSIQTIPSVQHASALALSALMAAVSVCAVFGAWRVETEQRRNFALILREQRKQAALSERNSELGELTLRDALTGSANRRAYDTWKRDTWLAAEQWGLPVGLVLVDIDSFKLFNDCFGHAGGDMCLREVAHSLIDQLRGTTDMVARIGGEEFAIILPGADLNVAGTVAERIRHAVETLGIPHAPGAAHACITVSCGVASLAAGPLRTPEELFAAADAALYDAKRGGRNRMSLAPAGAAAIAAEGQYAATARGRDVYSPAAPCAA